MASLREAAEKLTGQLDDLVGDMRKELTEGDVDFERLGGIADEISERASGLAETFTTVNETLMQRITAVRGGDEGKKEAEASADGGGESSDGASENE